MLALPGVTDPLELLGRGLFSRGGCEQGVVGNGLETRLGGYSGSFLMFSTTGSVKYDTYHHYKLSAITKVLPIFKEILKDRPVMYRVVSHY